MLEVYNKDRTKQKAQVIKKMTGRTENYVREKCKKIRCRELHRKNR